MNDRRHDLGALILGGIIVILFFWWKGYFSLPFLGASPNSNPIAPTSSAFETGSPGSVASGGGCNATTTGNAIAPLPSAPDVNNISGRGIGGFVAGYN